MKVFGKVILYLYKENFVCFSFERLCFQLKWRMGTESSKESQVIDIRSDSYATNDSTNKVKAKPRTVSNGTILGRQEITIYSCKNSNLPNSFTMQKPKVDLGKLYEDRMFPLHVERGRWSRSLPSWKRPKV